MGVLLIDVVLGYASHPDPAGVLAPVIREALAARPQLAVVGYVLGTEEDPQVLSRQEARAEPRPECAWPPPTPPPRGSPPPSRDEVPDRLRRPVQT